MTPEEKCRQEIDAQLAASGWAAQTKDKINLAAERGVAVCELSFATGGPDYTLFVDGKALGTVEAKNGDELETARAGNLAADITADLEAAMEQFATIAEYLKR